MKTLSKYICCFQEENKDTIINRLGIFYLNQKLQCSLSTSHHTGGSKTSVSDIVEYQI